MTPRTVPVVATPGGVRCLNLKAQWPAPWATAVHPADLAVLAAEHVLREWGLQPIGVWDLRVSNNGLTFHNDVRRIT